MRRLLPGWFNRLTLLSLLLAVATSYLWKDSFSSPPNLREAEEVRWLSNQNDRVTYRIDTSYLISHRGWVQFESLVTVVRGDPNPYPPIEYHVEHSHWRRWGDAPFYGEEDRVSRHYLLGAKRGLPGLTVEMCKHRCWRLAYWWLTVALSLLPAWWVVATCRRWRRRTRGLCVACGYDLRATPERCPECGAAHGPAGAGTGTSR